MKKYSLFSIMLLSLLIAATLASCAPAAGEEPAAAAPESIDEVDGASSGLATVPSTEADKTPDDALELDAAVEIDEDNDVDDEGTQSEPSAAVTPAVVDLSKITPQPPTEGETPREMPAPGIPNPSIAASNRASVELADTLGIDVDDVEIISVQQVEWPDSSLGCPKAGQNYLMVITPGFRVILEAGGQQVEYHTNIDGSILAQCGDASQLQKGTVDR